MPMVSALVDVPMNLRVHPIDECKNKNIGQHLRALLRLGHFCLSTSPL